MCFTSSDRTDDPPPRPAQIPQQQQSVSSFRPPPSAKVNMPQDQYAPPPGPPPSHRPQAGYDDVYNVPPPPGPPPSQRQQQPTEDYLAPEGPPPSHHRLSSNNPFRNPYDQGQQSSPVYEPPPGPPPSHTGKPTQQDLQDALDTAPPEPPPDFFAAWEESPANNATAEDAEAGKRWCYVNPLYDPVPHAIADSTNIKPVAPPYLDASIKQTHRGWQVQNKGRDDKCLTTYPPLYSEIADSPLKHGRPKEIYYEVQLGNRGGQIPLALGYIALPYPPFRAPGWNRGSLGVHGDDGHRFVNFDEGGIPFTEPFRPNERLGLGMRFKKSHDNYGHSSNPHAFSGQHQQQQRVPIDVTVFFTRGGREVGSWDLHEPKDATQIGPEGVLGLEGLYDVFAAVGFFGKTDFELIFEPGEWLWKGWQTSEKQGY